MDPLRRVNSVQLQDFPPKPLDLSQQISDALDLVKRKANQSIHVSGSHGLRSPRSELAYSAACVPLNFSLQNGFAQEPEPRGAAGKASAWCTVGGNADSGRARVLFPAVETLSSECSGPAGAASASSDDSSEVEVPANDASPPVTDSREREQDRTGNSNPVLTESDRLQDSDSLEPRTAPSTSEAENFYKSAQSQSGPPSAPVPSPSQKRAPETKGSKNQRRKGSPSAKKATAKRSRKKKKFPPASCALAPDGPEIKLKFASCKDEKRESRWGRFSPYVRMEVSACTVVNFEDDAEARLKKRRQTPAAPGTVPGTSCLHLGRVGSGARGQLEELCCLCGRAANAGGLGDLHGPYHPHKASADLPVNGHADPGAKRTRVSAEVRERWVHEDCGVWSAGVFLVKGKLYGLEEAVRLAQETVCSCCLAHGATLGCFIKGCPNKYHFPCALQTGCVFNEENFTLRCPKHKNKSGAAVNRLQSR